jgi:ABC-type sulfate/molybdate transport systems ATPase subunit
MEEVWLIIKKTDTTTLFVTHDWKEAVSISDRIAVLNVGKILEIDTPQNTYNNPKNEYTGRFFGKVNILKARTSDSGFETPIGFIEFEYSRVQSKEISLFIRPEGFVISKEKRGICGEVKRLSFFGQYQEVRPSIKNRHNPPYELIVNLDSNYKIREKDFIYVVPKKERLVFMEHG